jgi:hypothetical protein
MHDLESGVAAELVAVLRRAADRGLIDTSLDVRAIAAVLEAVSFGLVLLRHIDPSPPPEALADALERIFTSMLPASG